MTSPSGLKAVIVDEWALYRQGVASVLRNLGIDIVGEAAGSSDGMMRLWSARPDLLVAGSPASATSTPTDTSSWSTGPRT
jgi:DNA-binding NarL/FixJ family response regulator